MKHIVLFSICILIINASFAQKKKKVRPEDTIEQYWFVMIKTGPKDNAYDSATKAKLFEGHMANINKLYYDGILKVAGPFGKNDYNWRGIFVFDGKAAECKTKADVERIIQTDPAIAAEIFVVEVSPWYTSPMGSFKHGKPKKPKS
ncbi:YciI family protein [Ferruginibacter sp. SUN002]|uniref:YciI family protein n=1 Tax=Ferruginibacter sp. SUN002 TaxID=2937789 RepID=UPI003D362CAF